MNMVASTMIDRKRIDRRTFFTRASVGVLGTMFMTGCDRLAQSGWFQRTLATAEDVNEKLHHLITPRRAMAREFSETDLSTHFRSNGTTSPDEPDYRALADKNFAGWRLEVGGLVKHAARFSLAELREFPSRTQITRHDCVEGWSCIGKWTGVRLGALLEHVTPEPDARYVVFYCADALSSPGDKYYESIDFDDAYHPQTILAYEFNDEVLPVPHGAPLRLRVERQLGYKMAKYIMRMEVVESISHIAGGNGGYWEDRGYAWYAGI